MEKTLTKKSIKNLQKNAETMPNIEFKTQATSILGALTNCVKKTIEDGQNTSNQFFNGVNKEMDILSKMIDSDEYEPAVKVEFSNRVSKLVDKLHKKGIIKDVTILAGLGALSLAIIGAIVYKK